MSIIAAVGESLPLTLVVNDGNTGLYPEVRIFDEAGTATPVFTSAMSHVADGCYRTDTSFNITTAEKFTAVFIIFDDSGRTIESAIYSRASEVIISDLDSFVVASGS